MYTLLFLLILWGIFSAVNIYKKSKKNNEPFNIFEYGIINYFGFMIGLLVFIIIFVMSCLKYLP